MSFEAHKEKCGSLTIRILADDNPESPRTHDNMGTMVYWHRRYNLGDVDGRKTYGDAGLFLRNLASDHTTKDATELEDEEVQKIVDEHYLLLPLSLLDHSGLRMRVGRGAWECDPGGWDSGQVGWIYVSLEKAAKEQQIDMAQSWDCPVPKRDENGNETGLQTLKEWAAGVLTCEVNIYDQFLSGSVYGYVVENEEGDSLDSCWGFFGSKHDPNSSWEYMLTTARDTAKHIEARSCIAAGI